MHCYVKGKGICRKGMKGWCAGGAPCVRSHHRAGPGGVAAEGGLWPALAPHPGSTNHPGLYVLMQQPGHAMLRQIVTISQLMLSGDAWRHTQDCDASEIVCMTAP